MSILINRVRSLEKKINNEPAGSMLIFIKNGAPVKPQIDRINETFNLNLTRTEVFSWKPFNLFKRIKKAGFSGYSSPQFKFRDLLRTTKLIQDNDVDRAEVFAANCIKCADWYAFNPKSASVD